MFKIIRYCIQKIAIKFIIKEKIIKKGSQKFLKQITGVIYKVILGLVLILKILEI